jgi:glycosyltransferase involved in cell wall biosynthesis
MTEQQQSRISVVIPVHNGAAYLAEAIGSVLEQTLPAYEVFVIDDGSEDDSAAIAGAFAPRVHSVSQRASGAAAARNRGVSLSTGEILAFLDADDLWMPHKLASQQAALDADRSLDLVFGYSEQFISQELDDAARARIDCPHGSAPGVSLGTMLARRSAFERVGNFETGWEIGEFLAWFTRARELGLREMMLPEVVLRRRLHKTNQGQHKRAHYANYAQILKATLDRRRKQKTTAE